MSGLVDPAYEQELIDLPREHGLMTLEFVRKILRGLLYVELSAVGRVVTGQLKHGDGAVYSAIVKVNIRCDEVITVNTGTVVTTGSQSIDVNTTSGGLFVVTIAGTQGATVYVSVGGGLITTILVGTGGSGGGGGGGTGDITDGTSLGTGADVFKDKNATTLEFRSIVAGTGIVVDENSDDITISVEPGTGEMTFFGTGDHGDLNFDGINPVVLAVGGTVVSTLTPTSSVYTLNTDVLAQDMIVASGVTIMVAGYRIFAKGTLTNDGHISSDGANGTGAPGGAFGGGGTGAPGVNSGFVFGNVSGGNGGAQGGGTDFQVGSAVTSAPFGAKAGAHSTGTAGRMQGGRGGWNTASSPGGNGGNITLAGSDLSPNIGVIWNMIEGRTPTGTILGAGSGGGGGVGGAGAGENGGGGGGAGGGVTIACATTFAGVGTITAKGGTGGAGSQLRTFGTIPCTGGGGGGGGGGIVAIVTAGTANPTASATGGIGGIAGIDNGTGNGPGANGGDGFVRRFFIGGGSGGGGGTLQTVSNVGTGEGVFKQIVTTDVQLKSIKAGDGILITGSANEIEIEANTGSVPLHVIYGDGSDGDAVFDGSSTVLGIVPSSSNYILTRDFFFHDLTIASGVTVYPAGFRVFVSGVFHHAGTISAKGGNGGTFGAPGGATSSFGPLGAGANGGAVTTIFAAQGFAGAGSAFCPVPAVSGTASGGTTGPTVGANGGRFGGGGGGGTASVAGANGGGVAPYDNSKGGLSAFDLMRGRPADGGSQPWTGGSGGGGGSTADGAGGGGGAGGGVLFVAYGDLDDQGGIITAAGGTGGAGSVAGPSVGPQGGSGGGGGGGGLIGIVSGTDTYPTCSVAGGTGGIAASGSANGGTGGAGVLHKWYGGSLGFGNADTVPDSRTISTTSPLHGGGALSSNLTLTVDDFDSTHKGVVPASTGTTSDFLRADGTWAAPIGGVSGATNVGGEKEIYKTLTSGSLILRTLKAGSNVTLTQNANDITIDATGGGGGGGGGSGGSGLYSSLMTAPPTQTGTGFTSWANQPSGSTVSDTSSGIVVTTPAQGIANHLAALTIAAPAAPYSIKALILHQGEININAPAIIGWSDGSSSSNKVTALALNPHAGFLEVTNFNNFNSFNAVVYNNSIFSSIWWVRLRDDGTSIYIDLSTSGEDSTFVTVYTVVKSSGFLGGSGYTNIVFGASGFNGLSKVCLASWSVNGAGAGAGGRGPGLFGPLIGAIPTQVSTGLAPIYLPTGASVTDVRSGILLKSTSTAPATPNLAAMGIAAPAPPYTVTALLFNNTGGNYVTNAGLGFSASLSSSANHVLLFNQREAGNNGRLGVYKFNNFTGSYIGADLENFNLWSGPHLWLQVSDDGTNVHFSYSFDGEMFFQFYQVAKSSGVSGAYNNIIVVSDGNGGQAATLVAAWAIT